MRTNRGSSHLGGGGIWLTPPDQTHTPWPDTPLPVNKMTHACENITFPASQRYVVCNYII